MFQAISTTVIRVFTAFMILVGTVFSAHATDQIVWAKGNEATSLDPHTDYNGITWQFFYPVYDTLVSTGDDLSIVPDIAKSWEQPTPTTYIFHLRKNAAFSNGRALLAADVVGSLDRVLNPATGSWWAPSLGKISKISAVDDYTVKIELKVPYTGLLAALAGSNAAILPMKELKEGTFDPTRDIMGSGPYMVSEHLQNQSWTYVKNPYYWRAGYPRIDKFKILIIPGEASRIAALRDGRANIATFENSDVPLLLKNEQNISVFVQKTTSYWDLEINAISKASPFRSKKLRQALNLAIDRQEMAQLALNGASDIEYPLPKRLDPSSACKNATSSSMDRKTRLERAKKLLKESGYDGETIELIVTSELPSSVLLAQVLQQQAHKIGMNIKVRQVGYNEWVDAVYTKSKFDFTISWLAGYGDPALVLAMWIPDYAGYNTGFAIPVPELTKKIEALREVPRGEKRDQLISSACKLIDENANMLALVEKNDIIAYRKDQLSPKLQDVEGYFDTLKYLEEYKPAN